ncbi:MAG: AraC family transcriptional regulator [Lentisphaeria bacterium]|nr:AraC family transcriptional regulator [Lentisphaeria bacterium]
MKYLYHYQLESHISPGKMPLGVVSMYRTSWRPKRFHDHDHSEIAIVLKGKCVHLCGGKSVSIQAGDLLVVHPGSTHTYDQFDQMEMVNIIYDTSRLYLPVLDGNRMPFFRILFPDDPENIHQSPEPVLHLAPDALETISGMIHNMETELKSTRPGRSLYCLAVFLQIVVILCRLYSGTDQLDSMPFQIGEAVAYINTHYRQTVSVEQLARKACMSRRNFFLQFKKTAGCTPIQYLIRLRISRATELLLYSEMSIGDIAAQCGFCDSNYFCKTFRAQTGMSPRQFRLRNEQ